MKYTFRAPALTPEAQGRLILNDVLGFHECNVRDISNRPKFAMEMGNIEVNELSQY